MRYSLFFLAIFLLVFIKPVTANFAEDYKTEFSIDGETCEIMDSFIYDVHQPQLFNSQHKYTTFPVLYQCCNNKSCISVIFDGKHKTFIEDYYLREIIDLNFIRYNLHNGNLSENYFEVKGLDICYGFGFGDAKKETLNLASGVVESSALVIGTEKSLQVVKTIKIARNLGAIGKFNPTLFIAGVTCGYDDKNLNLALEHLGNINAYLRNINNGYSQEGYTNNLTNSAVQTKYYLEEYTKSVTAIVRGGTNFILNFFKGLFQFSMNPEGKLEFDKTEYQIAEETLKAISGFNFYFSNPNKELILYENSERIRLKVSQFNESYESFGLKFENVSKVKPSYLNVKFSDLFFNPNYNLSYGDYCYKTLKNQKGMAESYYSEIKFNSAIRSLENSDYYFNCSRFVFERENSIEREFDIIWVYLIIIAVVVYIILKNKKNSLEEYLHTRRQSYNE